MRLTEQAHQEIKKFLKPGDRVIDATAGNGYDTQFLANLVGSEGVVFAFDIQKESIEESSRLIENAGLSNQVIFLHSCHSKISITLPDELIGTIRVVTFNLGYLPGGNKELITKPETTLSALIQAYDYLTEDGIISLIVYRGHPGGQDEYDQLEKLMKKKNWAFEKSTGNQSDDCPVLFLIRKT